MVSQGHFPVTLRLVSLLCRWDIVTKSPGTSMDHAKLTTPGRTPKSLQQAGMRGIAASSGQLPALPTQTWARFSVPGLSSLWEPKLFAANIWTYDSRDDVDRETTDNTDEVTTGKMGRMRSNFAGASPAPPLTLAMPGFVELAWS